MTILKESHCIFLIFLFSKSIDYKSKELFNFPKNQKMPN